MILMCRSSSCFTSGCCPLLLSLSWLSSLWEKMELSSFLGTLLGGRGMLLFSARRPRFWGGFGKRRKQGFGEESRAFHKNLFTPVKKLFLTSQSCHTWLTLCHFAKNFPAQVLLFLIFPLLTKSCTSSLCHPSMPSISSSLGGKEEAAQSGTKLCLQNLSQRIFPRHHCIKALPAAQGSHAAGDPCLERDTCQQQGHQGGCNASESVILANKITELGQEPQPGQVPILWTARKVCETKPVNAQNT